MRVLAAAIAGAVVLGVGAVTLPSAFADDTGTIAGHLTDASAPIPYAYVTVYDTTYGYIASTSTDFSGAFQFPGLLPGGYKVQFYFDGLEQWTSQKSSFAAADVVTVVAGQTTTVEEAVRPYGNISGHVTNSDGTPAVGAFVSAVGVAGSIGGSTTTDGTGLYTIKYLPGGSYRVSFNSGFNSPTQYANNAMSYDQAALIAVTVGATTTLDQSFLPLAIVSGRITDGGVPVAGVQVTLVRVGSYDSSIGYTDETGTYRISAWPGTYTVGLNRNGLFQWVPGKLVESAATHYAFAAGPNTLDEQLLPTGTISGRVTLPDGSAVPFASISADGATGSVATNTDFQGNYTLRAYPGQYRVTVVTQYGTVRVTDPVTVVANQANTVDVALPQFGSVTVTAVDSVTGAAISAFCANAAFGYVCTTDGTVVFSQALPGAYLVSGYAQDEVHLGTSGSVQVTSGSNASLALAFAPGGTVTATMRDRQTLAPILNACLELVDITKPSYLGTTRRCSDASGTVQDTLLTPGTYKAFVWAMDGVHGDLWVDQGGNGVGQFDKARTITVGVGQSVAMGTVLMDPAGTLSGTVTDEATGAPIAGGVVALSSWDYGIGGQDSMFLIDSQGHYTVPNLGPYQWTLHFSSTQLGYAAEWMGDEANRDKAAHVKVKKGGVTTYDTALGPGTKVTGQIFGPDGTTPAFSARIVFVNADSADNMGVADYYLPLGSTTYTAAVKGVQRVKIRYEGSADGTYYSGWLGGTTFSDAAVYTIPDGGEFVLNVTMTSQTQ
jgi:hypothetical protein